MAWHRDRDWARDLWRSLGNLLLAVEEDWDVWINWYERRLAGAPLGLPLERAWLNLTEEDWKQGPGPRQPQAEGGASRDWTRFPGSKARACNGSSAATS